MSDVQSIERSLAKVNLNLRVGDILENGLHGLESLMVPVSLADELHILRCEVVAGDPARSEISVVTDQANLPVGTENLAGRTAAAFAAEVDRRVVLGMRIVKRIPAGAGLGGGSSNAAATLRFLNHASGCLLDQGAMVRLALKLGSDVPFFLQPGAKVLVGVGDRLLPYSGALPRFLVLCSDGVHLATRDVFRVFDTLTSESRGSRRPGSVMGWTSPFDVGNDLEGAAILLHPGIGLLKQVMQHLGLGAVRMTGSGSVVFGVAENLEEAARIADLLRGRGFWSKAVEVLG